MKKRTQCIFKKPKRNNSKAREEISQRFAEYFKRVKYA